MKKWVAKIKGGIEKNGLDGVIKKEMKKLDEYARELDNSLGNPSHLKSSIPEKRKKAEEKIVTNWNNMIDNLKIPTSSLKNQNIDVEEKDLRKALTYYINYSSVEEKISSKIMDLVNNKSLSNTQVASKTLALGNQTVNCEVKKWILHNMKGDVSINDLKVPAFHYYFKHQNEQDVGKVVMDKKYTEVKTFASDLFGTNHPELSAEIAKCLLGDSVVEG